MGYDIVLTIHMQGNQLGMVGELTILGRLGLVDTPSNKALGALLAASKLVPVLGVYDLAFKHFGSLDRLCSTRSGLRRRIRGR